MGKKLLFILTVPLLFAIPSFAAPQAVNQQKSPASEPITLRQSPAAETAMRESGCCSVLTRQNDLAHQVVKTYYLKNIKSPTEMQEVLNGLRTVLEFQRVQSVVALPALVVRGSAEQVTAADKFIAELDRPRTNSAAQNDRGGVSYRLDFALHEVENG